MAFYVSIHISVTLMELEPALLRIGNKLPSYDEPPEVFRPIRVTIRANQMKYPLRTHISANHSTSLCQLKLTLSLTFHDRLQKRVRTLLHLNPAEKTFRFRLTEADVGSSYSGRINPPSHNDVFHTTTNSCHFIIR